MIGRTRRIKKMMTEFMEGIGDISRLANGPR